jgi:hypothetical protein
MRQAWGPQRQFLVHYTSARVVDDCSPLANRKYVSIWLNDRELCCGAELFSTLRHYSKPTNACQATYRVPRDSLSAIHVLWVVDDCSLRKYVING